MPWYSNLHHGKWNTCEYILNYIIESGTRASILWSTSWQVEHMPVYPDLHHGMWNTYVYICMLIYTMGSEAYVFPMYTMASRKTRVYFLINTIKSGTHAGIFWKTYGEIVKHGLIVFWFSLEHSEGVTELNGMLRPSASENAMSTSI